ncbi:MAG TPA: hypothetical protein VM093_05365 [Aeromicrobium sp.]|nr:hypothetical protein [Aeromicrobium sp.]
MSINASERLRKFATGMCLILAPAGLLVGTAMHPRESYDAAEQLSIIGHDPGRWAMAHWIIAVAAVLLAGAVIGLAHLIHDRKPSHAIIGGAMGVVGALSLAAVAFAEGAFASQLGRFAGGDGVLAAFKAATTGTAFVVILLGALLGPLSAIVLGAGAYRANVVARWAAAATMAGGACVAVSLPLNLHVLTVIGSALLLAGLAPIGVMVLAETDEEWAHTPARMSMA